MRDGKDYKPFLVSVLFYWNNILSYATFLKPSAEAAELEAPNNCSGYDIKQYGVAPVMLEL